MGTGPSTEKIVAHAAYLLNDFLQLRERYSLLHPMLFDGQVVSQYGFSKQTRGFLVLQRSLFLSCCQDIAKLTLDDYSYTPSMHRILTDIASPDLLAELRQRNCDAELSCDRNETNPTLAAIYKSREPEQIVKYCAEFDCKYDKAMAAWADLKESKIIYDCLNIRNRITAHTQIHRKTYKPLDIRQLGVTYSDIAPTIETMQALIEMIGGLVRGTSFAWERFNMNAAVAANDFWRIKSAEEE